MNKLTLVITEQAYEDLDLISNFIANDNVEAAKKHLKLLVKSCRTLAQFPNLGVKRPDFSYKDIMFYVVKKRYNFCIHILNPHYSLFNFIIRGQRIDFNFAVDLNVHAQPISF